MTSLHGRYLGRIGPHIWFGAWVLMCRSRDVQVRVAVTAQGTDTELTIEQMMLTLHGGVTAENGGDSRHTKHRGTSMSEESNIPILNHDLADDELAWMRAVYEDFSAACQSAGRHADALNPKEVLRAVLGKEQYRLPTPMDLTGPGPWRGKNRHGRFVAAVFLPRAELHQHARSRTDQFTMYVVGEADAFSIDGDLQPLLTPVTGGDHFHNPPGAPHAFLPRVGRNTPDNWEIAFIAITPRSLRDDTQRVSDDVRAAYKQVVGTEAPLGV
ncbi:MAG: hypothetical protein AB7O80_20605 [Acetobacteraceae bacterium]